MIDGLCAYIKDVKSRLSYKDKQIAELKKQLKRKEKAMKETLNKIANTCSILTVKAKCFDLHDDKKEVLKDMTEQIDSIYENYATLLKKFKEASNED